MKKVLAVLSILIVIAGAFVFTKSKSTAKEAQFSVQVKNQKVQKDEEVTIYVTVKSSVAMTKLEAYMQYDSNYLEFVKARESSVVGASGTLTIHDTFDTPVTEKQYAITLKALEVGTTNIEINDIYIEDDKNSDVIEINKTNAKVEIQANTSEGADATLSSLLVFPGKLSKKFKPSITEYEVNVESDVTELILSAHPTLEDSVVTIEKPDVLKAGKNTIKILVTAPSGDTKTYVITVNRAK